uniref:Uncharacterized protein n=1 Tax=Amphimedon queenslandica TaxID=400682 RepID=A0A1X7V654_AMPQE
MVYDAYKELTSKLDDTFKEWNFSVLYDHRDNHGVNATIETTIKGAIRTYFKSFYGKSQRISNGTDVKTNQKTQQRQRMSNNKLESVCKVEYLSSDESAVASDEPSDEAQTTTAPLGKFVKHSLN